MTVQELIDLLQKYPNKQATVYMQCANEYCTSSYNEPTYIIESPDKQGIDIQSIPLYTIEYFGNSYIDYPDKDIEQCKET